MAARLVFLAVPATLALVGCGGDSGSLSKSEYLKQGDEICAVGTFQIGAEAKRRFNSPQAPLGRASEFAEKVIVPTLRTEVLAKLWDLPAPEGDEATVAAIYDALERGVDRLAAQPSALRKPNLAGIFDEANRRAQAYGFRQCGQG